MFVLLLIWPSEHFYVTRGLVTVRSIELKGIFIILDSFETWYYITSLNKGKYQETLIGVLVQISAYDNLNIWVPVAIGYTSY